MNDRRTTRTTDDGRRRTPEHGYTISSPCEPNGSGDLKIHNYGPFIHCNTLFVEQFRLEEFFISRGILFQMTYEYETIRRSLKMLSLGLGITNFRHRSYGCMLSDLLSKSSQIYDGIIICTLFSPYLKTNFLKSFNIQSSLSTFKIRIFIS